MGGSCEVEEPMGEEGGVCEMDAVSGGVAGAAGKRPAPKRGAKGERKKPKHDERMQEYVRAREDGRHRDGVGRGEGWRTPGRGYPGTRESESSEEMSETRHA